MDTQCAGTAGPQVGVTEWFTAMGDLLLAWVMGDGAGGMEACGERVFIMVTGAGIRVAFIVVCIVGIIRAIARPNSTGWRQPVRGSLGDIRGLIFTVIINVRVWRRIARACVR